MKNQYAKFKNPNGSKKRRISEILNMTSGFLGQFKFSLWTGKLSKYTPPAKVAKKRRYAQKNSRKSNK